MKMRTFIQIKPGKGAGVSSHARYMSERERNPNREEPQSRPIFTHDRDGLKHKAADRYLAGGSQPKARSDSLLHIIISFNSQDRKELEKLERAALQSTNFDHSNKSTKIDHLTNAQAQIARDLPYIFAVRQMFKNVEERTSLSDLRFACSVHRHTGQTHVHGLLRREYIDKLTGEKAYLDKKGLPEEFVNGRDERGRARGGLLDCALSDSLDTLIPRRVRQPESPVACLREARSQGKVQNLNIEVDEPQPDARDVQILTISEKAVKDHLERKERVQLQPLERTSQPLVRHSDQPSRPLTLPAKYSFTR